MSYGSCRRRECMVDIGSRCGRVGVGLVVEEGLGSLGGCFNIFGLTRALPIYKICGRKL